MKYRTITRIIIPIIIIIIIIVVNTGLMWNVTLAGCNGGMLHWGWIEQVALHSKGSAMFRVTYIYTSIH